MFRWLENLVALLVERVFRLPLSTQWGGAIHFFIYDVVKILMLLVVMVFLISYIQTFFPPERTKKALEKVGGIGGNIFASLFGILTPFCSCSSIPIFIGLVEAGVPLGITFSFLITSPLVNEAAVVILWATFGWKIAVAYVLAGVIIGVLGGLLIGVFRMEKQVEEYVYQMKVGEVTPEKWSGKQRAKIAWDKVKEIVRRIWLFLLIGIAIGAAIHGWVPSDVLSRYAGQNNPFAVLVAVLIGVPLYSNATGTIPIAQALIAKGVGLGTALAFMMAVTALSLPEILLLRKVIKPRLIALFIGVTTAGIIMVGYLFNWIAPYLQ